MVSTYSRLKSPAYSFSLILWRYPHNRKATGSKDYDSSSGEEDEGEDDDDDDDEDEDEEEHKASSSISMATGSGRSVRTSDASLESASSFVSSYRDSSASSPRGSTGLRRTSRISGRQRYGAPSTTLLVSYFRRYVGTGLLS